MSAMYMPVSRSYVSLNKKRGSSGKKDDIKFDTKCLLSNPSFIAQITSLLFLTGKGSLNGD